MSNTEPKTIQRYSGREGKKLKAFELRFNGNTYAEIEKQTSYTVFYLQKKFYKGGDWYNDYLQWSTARLEDINQQMTTMFTGQAIEAMQMITNLSKGFCTIAIVGPKGEQIRTQVEVKDRTILTAAQDIVDRAGFKPPERITISTPADNKAEDLLKKIEEARIRRQQKTSEKKRQKKAHAKQ